MKITKEAIALFYTIFFSCYTAGKMSSEHNRKCIEKNLAKNSDLYFDDFCGVLQEWEDRKDAITIVARSLKKDVVDEEVISRYFGSAQHTKVILGDFAKEGLNSKNKIAQYIIFTHMLVPIRIVEINHHDRTVCGIYENEEIAILVKNFLYFEHDERKLSVDKVVLCHYPLVVDTNPKHRIVNLLRKLQKDDEHFMHACVAYHEGIDHAHHGFCKMLKKRMR